MAPEEKAKKLVVKFSKHAHECNNSDAKQCALIAVDEIINNIYKSSSLEKYHINNDTMNEVEVISYWQEVKKEIQNL